MLRTVHLCLAPIVALACFLPTPLAARQASPGFDHSYAGWSEVLRTCVRDDGFDYAKLKQDRPKLDAVLAELKAVTPEELAGWSEKQRFAFWINTYNAFCIQKVVDNYPLGSIRKLDGAFGLSSVFDKGFIPMKAHHPAKKNEALSLNDIEHEILRRQFKDARLHAAINCASKSCPPLRGEAFTAEELDAQLDEQMRAFANDPARNRLDPIKKELAVSEIFKWFAEDFERDAKSVKEFLLRYATPDKAELIKSTKIRYLDYDWSLNDVPRK
jgi:hypothetical protein